MKRYDIVTRLIQMQEHEQRELDYAEEFDTTTFYDLATKDTRPATDREQNQRIALKAERIQNHRANLAALTAAAAIICGD